jgi:hypothetical protein
MEPSGRNRWQRVANGQTPENRSNRPIGNRWQPTATVSERMVRRGSAVRVRKKALGKGPLARVFSQHKTLVVRAARSGVEPLRNRRGVSGDAQTG